MLKTLLKKKYLRRISGVKHEKFESCVSKLKPAWKAAQRRKVVTGRPYGIGDLQEHLLLLLMYYRTYTTHLFLAQVFKVDETTICRAIRRIAPLAERILKVKPDPILSENDLQLLIVDATEQRIERPKNQRDYYSGKAHACTIKTEVVIELNGRILRVSRPYEGRVHDFKIRQSEGSLPQRSDLGGFRLSKPFRKKLFIKSFLLTSFKNLYSFFINCNTIAIYKEVMRVQEGYSCQGFGASSPNSVAQ